MLLSFSSPVTCALLPRAAARQINGRNLLCAKGGIPRCRRRLSVVATFRKVPADGQQNDFRSDVRRSILNISSAFDEAVARLVLASWGGVELRLLWQVGQVAASLAFVALYIWSTYQPAARGSWRHSADLALSAVFAVDLVARIRSSGSSWPLMLLTPLSLLDVLSFAPGLLELCGASWLGAGLQGVGVDLRWFRIFRALRLLRLCLLTGNLPLMKLSRSALLSGAVNVRLMQLVASVLVLLFTSASLVHAVERLPWHDALYFVTTTLTTVGYGDVVVKSMAGRLIVLVFMAVGVVLIPVRTGQLWGQLASRRLTAGTLTPGRPVVLVSGRLSEVRGFADLTDEFFHQVQVQRFIARDVHLMVLGNRPSHEFTAFQELHDQRITLVEGSVLSAADLVRCRAEAAEAVLVLGDRFVNDAASEDLDVLFRVWAIKSYTKCVPLTVQVLRASALAKVSPFLDPHQDVVMSVEQMRHRLLALSALCPGASTLLGNLLHTASPSGALRDSVFRARGAPTPKLAGRSWFAEYVRGCGHDLHVVAVKSPAAAGAATAAAAAGVVRGPGGGTVPRVGGDSGSLVGCSFGSVVSAAFQQRHLLVIGIMAGNGFGQVVLNPPHRRRLLPSDQLVVIAHSDTHAEAVWEPAVVTAAAAATKKAEEEAAVTAAATATAAMSAAAAPDHGAAAAAAAAGGGDSSSSSDSSEAEGPAAAAAFGRGGHRRNGEGNDGGGSGGSGGGGAQRVKRYFPSLASWDEDLPDYYPDREGTFFTRIPQSRQSEAGVRQGWQGTGGGVAAGELRAGGGGEDWGVAQGEERKGLDLAGRGSAGDVAGPGAGTETREKPALAREVCTGSLPGGNGDDAVAVGPGPEGSGGGGAARGNGMHVNPSANGLPNRQASSGSSGGGGGASVDGDNPSSSSTTGFGITAMQGVSAAIERDGRDGGDSGSSSDCGDTSGVTAGRNSGSSWSSSGSGTSPPPPLAAVLSPSLDEPAAAKEADIGSVVHPRTTFGKAGARVSQFGGGYVSGVLSGSSSSTAGVRSTTASGGSSVAASAAAPAAAAAAAPAAAAAAAAAAATARIGARGATASDIGARTTSGSSSGFSIGSSSVGGGMGSAAGGIAGGGGPSGVGGGWSGGGPTSTPSASAAYISAATTGAVQAVGQAPPTPMGRPYALADAPWRQPGVPGSIRGHIILAGAIDSFVEFARVLHSCAGMRDSDSGTSGLEVVVLHPNPSEATVLSLGAMGPTRVVRGSPADPRALEQAGAAQARCLVYLGHSERPGGHRSASPSPSDHTAASTDGDYGSTSRAGVQADAEALLTCYGVGEEAASAAPDASTDGYGSPGEDPPATRGGGWGPGGFAPGVPYFNGAVRGHSVVELSFTSSVRFLQPGLLLQGTSVWDESCSVSRSGATPRRSWRQRREAELAAAQQGLVQWQTNIYYGAGRVVVPALVDTFTIQAFAKRNLLLDVMSELCGDDGRPHGTPLRLLPVPRELVGRPYRELFDAVVSHGSVPLGLYRSKSENPAWRLHFVSTNPAWEDVVSPGDKVFVLRPAEQGEAAEW